MVEQVGVETNHLSGVARFFIRASKDILAVFVELAGGRVERKRDVPPGLIAGPYDGFHYHLYRLFVVAQVGSEAALVADVGRVTALLEHRRERVKHFGAHPHRVGERRCAMRHDHELLHVDIRVGMLAAIDHVHHRHRQNARGGGEIGIEWHPLRGSRRMCCGKRHPEHRVGAEVGLILGTVEREQRLVQRCLASYIYPFELRRDYVLDVSHRLEDALSAVSLGITIAQFQRLMGAGGGSRRHGSAPDSSVAQPYVDLNRRISARVENLSRPDFANRGGSHREKKESRISRATKGSRPLAEKRKSDPSRSVQRSRATKTPTAK